jgi:predicted phosphodiesterase
MSGGRSHCSQPERPKPAPRTPASRSTRTGAAALRPIADAREYRLVTGRLERQLKADPGAAALVRELERVLEYEFAHPVSPEARFSSRLSRSPAPRARRTAIISDIHGNHAGLLAALSDIERQRCDRIVCLGDLVEGGPDNEAVIATIQRLRVPCVRGNHDETNDAELIPASRRFLQALPEYIMEDDVLYTHISPRPKKRKIDHVVEAWNVFDESDFRLLFIGHVHVPLIFGKRSDTFGEAALHPFEYNRPYALSRDERYIVSIGAIGYGRDDVGRIRYAIYDVEAHAVELRAIDGPLLPLDHALGGSITELL